MSNIESKDQSLPQLMKQFSELMEVLAETGGEITPEFQENLDKIEVKADRYNFFIDRLENEIPYWKKQAENNKKMQKACEALIDALKFNLKNAMMTMGVQELEGSVSRVKLMESKGTLVIDEKLLPNSFKQEIVTVSHPPDKEKIRKAIENFEIVPGAEIVGGTYIRFFNAKPGKKAISE